MDLLRHFKKEERELKFYVVILSRGSRDFLWTGQAYDLDNALSMARRSWKENQNITDGRLSMYKSVPVADIVEDALQENGLDWDKIQKMAKKEDKEKSQLMQDIVASGNLDYFEKHKDKFNENERKYILENINKNA